MEVLTYGVVDEWQSAVLFDASDVLARRPSQPKVKSQHLAKVNTCMHPEP